MDQIIARYPVRIRNERTKRRGGEILFREIKEAQTIFQKEGKREAVPVVGRPVLDGLFLQNHISSIL
jgi:hypothetical protein